MLRGLVGELRADEGIARAGCLAGADDLAATTAEDAEGPGPGDSFYYLVRGQNGCGSGPYGTNSEGTDRGLPTTDCP